ncbi:hypothetical protein TCAL_16213 [Tigriopus californicus]|uniref:Uncharacterized protein n=1 Tax=Tigriopus californicus TaxID=6832 RepID=A0A553P1Z6_TIGCA|nr:hypothetical protein TCAL_16213 [Tigriopus californicus]
MEVATSHLFPYRRHLVSSILVILFRFLNSAHNEKRRGVFFACFTLDRGNRTTESGQHEVEKDVGVEAKYILLRDLRIQYQQHFLRPDAAFEVEAFCGVADEVAVKAGSYVSFSKRFLISYYGVLVSYMAIVVQSF